MPAATLTPRKRKRGSAAADSASDASSNHGSGSEAAMDVDDSAEPRSNTSGKKKGLSVTEMRNIKQNAQIFKSNTFHFQIESLLPNVVPKASHLPPLEKLMHDLHAHIMEIPAIPPQHPLEAARSLAKRGIAVPYPLPLPTEDTNWKVAYAQPREIAVVGSWGNKMTVKRQDGAPFGVDIAVEMPSDLFQEKDYLNSRFFHKRAFYVAVIAASLVSASALDVDVQYDSGDHDARKTCLLVKPRTASKLNAVVRIIPTLSPTSSPIPPARLSPAQANLRTGSETNAPTPLYNNTLALARLPRPLLLAVHGWASEAPAFADALRLLRVWAAQRGFGGVGARAGSVAGFAGRGAWWACVLGVLLAGEEDVGKAKAKFRARKTVGRGLSSYQLFKAALDFLAHRDFCGEPVFMKRSGDAPFDPSLFISSNPTFVDPSSTVNFLAGVPAGSLELLRHEARATLQHLDTAADPFPGAFLRDQRGLPTRFDIVLHVSLSSAKPPSPLDAGSSFLALLSSIPALVTKALGNRATLVTPLLPGATSRPLTSPRPTAPSSFLLGIRLDPAHAARLVDHGPAPDAPEAADFRTLWGTKAETRRFKDGRILESVVWEHVERAHIPHEIARHVLHMHFGVPPADVRACEPAYENVLRPGAIDWRAALAAFDGLVRALKSMDPEKDGVPLTLVSVLPVDEALRYLAPLPPRAVPTDALSFARLPPDERYVPPIDVVLQFEQSGRWPDDLAAVQKMKLVFFERMATWVQHNVDGASAHVMLDADAHSRPAEDNCALEVLTGVGLAFRFRIYHNREATLLQRVLEKRPPALRGDAPTPREQEAARVALALHTRRFVDAPKHHSAVAALHHARPAYAPAARLLKRWLAAHFLLSHIPPQALELLAALPFASATDAPGSAGVGFARLLSLLRDWDYALEPLLVPSFNAESQQAAVSAVFPQEKKGKALEEFKAMRARDPAMKVAWVICTEDDAKGMAWTSAGPSRLVAERVRAVARATAKYLEDGLDAGIVDVATVFTHPLNDYDFVLHLDPKALPRASDWILEQEAKGGKSSRGYANQPVAIGQDDETPVVDFDPVAMYFADLRRIYAGVAEFFWDPLGGRAIGGVWDPSVRKSHAFRVFLGFNSTIVPGNAKKPQVTLNEEATLVEMERMGRGLVTRVMRYGIIAPDLLGYGGTDKPANAVSYKMRLMAQDIVDIMDRENATRVIAIAHDWGCALLSRIALYYPPRLLAYAFFAMSFMAPMPEILPFDVLLPLLKERFGAELSAYQEFFVKPGAAAIIQANFDSFADAAYPEDPTLVKRVQTVKNGLEEFVTQGKRAPRAPWLLAEDLENLRKIVRDDGIDGPLNWYRAMIGGHNVEDDKKLLELHGKILIEKPVFFGAALKDYIGLADVQKAAVRKVVSGANLTIKEFDTGHFVNLESPEEVNRELDAWLQTII
ncbi:Nrap-domain-containing protein [Auricularia subglabra TFB-10046 SS5]|uniref:Nrap-domain-containing protein n=1 Tax=Auricularia subglabra (strain TFB-10046 / SS5) TaxID=717982 RepID=J0LDN8_AURST|nr:Nrap-domain-containing protein [Auricularia subglabra TFB-10046 SS5]